MYEETNAPCGCQRKTAATEAWYELAPTPSPAGPCVTLSGFAFDRSALTAAHAAQLDGLARDIVARGAGTRVEIVGHTDPVGPAAYNIGLGLRRAREVEAALVQRVAGRAPGLQVVVASQGERQPIPNNPAQSRRVVVCVQGGTTGTQKTCGPDATSWFGATIRNVAGAAAVIGVRALMREAQQECAALGIAFRPAIEGSVATAVLALEATGGAGARTAAATTQLAQARRGQAELLRLTARAVTDPRARKALALIGAAGTAWGILVRPGGRYDFKNTVLRGARAQGCPGNCPGTTTLCGICFGNDVPGNVLYGHLGRWLGYSELALQLGSQLAQLGTSKRWDPAHDTAAIHLGFALSYPVSGATLCAALHASKNRLNVHQCVACTAPLQGNPP
ncbi:MAG: OmpA family protein [Deltaproteobacteria bacterium]|nr:OmpA family protein [Deltaproteobacteria bacterium]